MKGPIAALLAIAFFSQGSSARPAVAPQARPIEAGMAQGQEDEPPTARELLQRALKVLKARKASPEAKAAAVEELLGLGVDGPRSLASVAFKESASLHSKNAKTAKKLFASFDKRAGAVLKKRLTKKLMGEIEEHRGVIKRNARDSSLTKATIKAESDPALAALKKHLSVTMNDVWEADEKLFNSYNGLLDALDAEALWLSRWTRARDALAGQPDGAGAAKRLKVPVAIEFDANGLVARLRIAAELATPMGEADKRTLQKNAALAGQIDAKELEGIRILNMKRVLIGIGVQAIDVKLCEAARGHSQDMNEKKFFSHTSPVPGKEKFGQRASLAGTSANAENIAMGSDTGEGVIKQWWYSPGHHRNMLGGQGRTGLGRFQRHWTQLFG